MGVLDASIFEDMFAQPEDFLGERKKAASQTLRAALEGGRRKRGSTLDLS
jgi:hypothetical protein